MSRPPAPHDRSPVCRELPDPPRRGPRVDVDELVRRLAPCDLLEDAPHGWAYVVPHGGAVLRDDGERCRLHWPDGTAWDLGADPFAALDEVAGLARSHPAAARDPALPPFTGGLVGALAYDLGRRVEPVAIRTTRDREQPLLHLRHADALVAVPPGRERALAVASPSDLTPTSAARRVQRLEERLRAVAAAPPRTARKPRVEPQVVATSLTHAEHLRAVGDALRSIAAGDVFQVNLSQRLTACWPGTTHGLYRALRGHSPAPHGAALPEIGVASVSPETFLAVDVGRVESHPIKGTRRRAADPALDAALADDLATADKDRAENVMIVDLVRNDLGRVCLTGTVSVPHLARLEAHPTVWHLVSHVRGRLAPGVGYGDLLRATFPCGSVTGAPKVAAMQRIEDLEPVRRGWYCGAAGFLAPGAARLSVTIRTATLWPDGTADYGAGGGIVADSRPDAEHAESLDKAAAFLRTVTALRVAGVEAATGVGRAVATRPRSRRGAAS